MMFYDSTWLRPLCRSGSELVLIDHCMTVPNNGQSVVASTKLVTVAFMGIQDDYRQFLNL